MPNEFSSLSLEELASLSAELKATIKAKRTEVRSTKSAEEEKRLSEARAMLVALVSDWATSYVYEGVLRIEVKKNEAGTFVAMLTKGVSTRAHRAGRNGHQAAPDKYVRDGAEYRTPKELYEALALAKPKSVSPHQGLVRLAHNGAKEQLDGFYAVYGTQEILLSAIESF